MTRRLISFIAATALFFSAGLPSHAQDEQDETVRVAVDPESGFILVWAAIIKEMGLKLELVQLNAQVRRDRPFNKAFTADLCIQLHQVQL